MCLRCKIYGKIIIIIKLVMYILFYVVRIYVCIVENKIYKIN